MAQLTASDIFTDSRDPGTNVNPKVLGSLWINYTTGEQFVCKDNTLNKNVWVSSTKVIREDLDKLEDSVSDKIDDITVSLNGSGKWINGVTSVSYSNKNYGIHWRDEYRGSLIYMNGFYVGVMKDANGRLTLKYKKQKANNVYINVGSSDPFIGYKEIPLYNPPVIKNFTYKYGNSTSYDDIIYNLNLYHITKLTISGSDITDVEFAERQPNTYYNTGMIDTGYFVQSKLFTRDYIIQNYLIYSSANDAFSGMLGNYALGSIDNGNGG